MRKSFNAFLGKKFEIVTSEKITDESSNSIDVNCRSG